MMPNLGKPRIPTIQDDLAIEEDHILDVRQATRLPHFEKVRGLVWRVAGPEQVGGGAGCINN